MNDAMTLARTYLAIWNETDAGSRQELIASTWSEDASYTDPMFDVTGHDGIEAMVSGFQAQFPDLTFRPVDDPEAHHDYLRFRWELVAKDGSLVAAGTDVGLIESGRLRVIAGFFDQAPVLDAA
jgi:hypothetical protein